MVNIHSYKILRTLKILIKNLYKMEKKDLKFISLLNVVNVATKLDYLKWIKKFII